MGSHKKRNVSVGTLGAGRGASWVTLVRLSALSAIFAMALTLGLSAPAPVKAADTANFPGLQDSYWVIDNLAEYELQIWDSACDSGAGCYRTINSTALPANGSNEWMDTDDTGSFRIRKHGDKIELFTLNQTRQEWIDGAQSGEPTYTRNPAGKTGYSYDMNPNNPDVIITYKNGAKDVNGNRSDVIVNIDKFAIYEPENAKNGTGSNYYAEYRRSLLDVGTNGFRFRNYLLQPKDCPVGDAEWKHGTAKGGSGNLSMAQGGKQYGTGTWIDAGIKIADGRADQTFLFSVGDLDVGIGQANPGSAKYWDVGGEGIDLGYGFDLDTLVVASTTKLDTYGTETVGGQEQYVKYSDHATGVIDPDKGLGNYIVGTADDGNSDQSRFFVLGAANGASFTWTSKTNCDTDFLETIVARQVWHEMPPVTMQVQAAKEYLGADLTDGLFNFQLAIDERADNLFKDNPYEPTGGAGTLDVTTGTITFPTLSFQLSDDETYNPIGTHYYKFYEVKGTDDSIVYDETVHTLKIVIEGADNDIGMRTLGYTLRAYLDDGEDPFFVTHSSMEAPYGIAKVAATGATSGAFLSHTFTDPATGHTYTYDEDKLVWVRDDGVEGDPPANATSTFDVPYAQARTMALAGVEGFDNDLLESTVWTEGDVQYKYYNNVPLNLTFEQASTVANADDLQGYTWTDGSDTYAWGEHTGLIPWAVLTEAEQSSSEMRERIWTDPATNDTYVYRPYIASGELHYAWIKNDSRMWAEINGDVTYEQMKGLRSDLDGVQYTTDELNSMVWTDPATGDTYVLDSRPADEMTKTEFLEKKLSGLVDRTGYENPKALLNRAWFVHKGQGNDEEIYVRLCDTSMYNYNYGQAVREGWSEEQLQSFAWFTGFVGVRYLPGQVYTYRGANWFGQGVGAEKVNGKEVPASSVGLVDEPPSNAAFLYYGNNCELVRIHHSGNSWTTTSLTSNVVPDDFSVLREYIPDEATSLFSYSSQWWAQTDSDGDITYHASLSEDFLNTLTIPATYYVWIDPSGQEIESFSAPPAAAVSDYIDTRTGWVKNDSELVGDLPAGSTADVTLYKTWLKEARTSDGSTGSFIEMRNTPAASSTASFPVRYGDASYTVQDGLVKENIRALPWTDPDTGNVYTWDDENNTWLENGTTPVNAPTDTAVAQLWSAPEDTLADTGEAGTFTNRKIYNLTVEKKISGTWASPEDEFQFTVNVPDLKGKSVEVVMATEASGGTPANNQTITADFDDAGVWSFPLRGGQSVTIPGITGRTAYSVSEGVVATYTPSAQVTTGDTTGVTNTVGTSSGAGAGAVSDDSLEADTTVTFTNTKREHNLTVSKTVTGDTGSTGTFAFTVVVPDVAGKPLVDSEGNPVVFDDSGAYGFTLAHGQSLTIVGIPEGAQYMVEESAESAEGYTTTVDGVDGRIASGELLADAERVFENAKFSPPAAGVLSRAIFNGWLWVLVCGVLGGIAASRVNRLRRN